MSALSPIATAKGDSRKRSCPLYPRKRHQMRHSGMSALGQKRTYAAHNLMSANGHKPTPSRNYPHIVINGTYCRQSWGHKMTNWNDRRQKFRAILNGANCIRPASVFDPLSARIAENLGFEIGLFAGSTAALTILGAPDLVLLTATELVQQAQRICRVTNMPLLVDGDHGYGNALNVARTIEELTNVGVAAATVEDTILPTPFGAAGASTLISLEEAVGKM